MSSTVNEQFADIIRGLAPYGLDRYPLRLHGFITGYAIADLEPNRFIGHICRECARMPEAERASLFLFSELILDALEEERFEPLLEWDGAEDAAQWIQGLDEALALADAEWRTRHAEALTHPKPEPKLLGAWAQRLYDSCREEVWQMPDRYPLAHTAEELDALSTDALVARLQELGVQADELIIEALYRRGPALLEKIDYLLDLEESIGLADVDEPFFWTPVHAIVLLGMMEGVEATDRLGARLATLDEDRLAAVGFYWASLFANKGEHGQRLLEQVAWNAEAHGLNRAAAVAALLFLAKNQGPEALEQRIDWVAQLGQEALPIEVRPFFLTHLLDFPRERYHDLLHSLVDGAIPVETEALDSEGEGQPLTHADVDEFFAEGDTDQLDDVPLDPRDFYEVVERSIRIQEALGTTSLEEIDEGMVTPPHDYPPSTTYVREAPKVGRNDPCPCGSGKKYKKCCMP